MTVGEWRKACPEGCACGKHRKRKQVHPSGCMCATCGGRKTQYGYTTACKPGCTCARHKGGAFTPEEVLARAEAKQARKVDRRRERKVDDPEYVAAEQAKKRERDARNQLDPEYIAKVRERQRLHGRRYFLKHKFGLSLDDWDALLIAQSGRCYLCADPLRPADIHVDHSHACCPGNRSCGRCVRGLACRWCNQGVGQFRDDPERLRRAATALEEAEARITQTA